LKPGLDTNQTCNILKPLIAFVALMCLRLKKTSQIEIQKLKYLLDMSAHPKLIEFFNHKMGKF
jgi:hypothetical protein